MVRRPELSKDAEICAHQSEGKSASTAGAGHDDCSSFSRRDHEKYELELTFQGMKGLRHVEPVAQESAASIKVVWCNEESDNAMNCVSVAAMSHENIANAKEL